MKNFSTLEFEKTQKLAEEEIMRPQSDQKLKETYNTYYKVWESYGDCLVIFYPSITVHTSLISPYETDKFPNGSKFFLKIHNEGDLIMLRSYLMVKERVYGLDIDKCYVRSKDLGPNFHGSWRILNKIYDDYLLKVLTSSIKTLQQIVLRIFSK